jgi:hypothetical protein
LWEEVGTIPYSTPLGGLSPPTDTMTISNFSTNLTTDIVSDPNILNYETIFNQHPHHYNSNKRKLCGDILSG